MSGIRTIGRRRTAGFTLIEMLVAALILAIGLVSLMGVWVFSFSMTRSNDELGIAQNLARHSVERMRSAGYLYADPTSIPQYYDVSQNTLPDATNAYYRVTVNLTRGTDQPGQLDYLNLKEVDVWVNRVSDGKELCRTSTYLSLGGV